MSFKKKKKAWLKISVCGSEKCVPNGFNAFTRVIRVPASFLGNLGKQLFSVSFLRRNLSVVWAGGGWLAGTAGVSLARTYP